MASNRPPSYDWIDKNLDERSASDFIEQYGEYCKKRGIPFDNKPYLQEQKFIFEETPLNESLVTMSPYTCGVPMQPGSLRRLPEVPVETPWRSVDTYRPTSDSQVSGSGRESQGTHSSNPSFVSGGGVPFGIPVRSADWTGVEALNSLNVRDLPLRLQVPSGLYNQTLPSQDGAGVPFNGIYNTLSQAYDLNITPRDMYPEALDPRYQPTDSYEPTQSTTGDFFQPDILFQASNRYTLIQGVTRDPITGAIMIHYGKDELPEYKGKMFDTPPVRNLGAPDILFDQMTNTGTVPVTRGQFQMRTARTNDIAPAKAPDQAHLSLAMREYAREMAGRQMVNFKNDNVAPIDSSANKHNPNNTFAPGGMYAMRNLMTTGNLLKTVDYDAANQPADPTVLGNYAQTVHPGYWNKQSQRYFQRNVEDYEVPENVQATLLKETMPQATLDASGFTVASTAPIAQPMAHAPSASLMGPTDAQGFFSQEHYISKTYTNPVETSAIATIDAQGFGNASMSGVQKNDLPRDVQMQSSTVDAKGFSNVASILARHNVNLQDPPSQSRATIDAYGFGSTIQAQPQTKSFGMTDTRPQMQVSGQGFTQTGQTQTSRQVYDYSMPAQATTDSAGFQAVYNMQASKPAFNMDTSVSQSQTDSLGFSHTGMAARAPTALLQTDMMPSVSADASGFTNVGTAPVLPARANVSLGPSYTADGNGMTNTSTFQGFARFGDASLAGQSQAEQAAQTAMMGVRDELQDWEQNQTRQEIDVFVNSVYGGPTPYTSNVTDSTVQALNQTAIELSMKPGEQNAWADTVRGQSRIAQTRLGTAVADAAIEKELMRGKTDFYATNFFGLDAASPGSSGGSQDSPQWDARIYGTRQ